MIHIIYMAAGNSRRFGSNKLFYELDGKPMYRHLLDRLAEIKNRYNKSKSDSQTIDITVVTRYREILDYCACIPDCHAVISPDSEKGISYTIKAGIMAVQEQKKLKKSSEVTHHTAEKEEYYMFAVADQPYLKSQSVIKLIDRVLKNTGGKRLAFSLRCGDAVGNPCVFNSSLIPQLLSLEGDKGGRSVAKKHDCVYVDIADERELLNVHICLAYPVYMQDFFYTQSVHLSQNVRISPHHLCQIRENRQQNESLYFSLLRWDR